MAAEIEPISLLQRIPGYDLPNCSFQQYLCCPARTKFLTGYSFVQRIARGSSGHLSITSSPPAAVPTEIVCNFRPLGNEKSTSPAKLYLSNASRDRLISIS